MVRPASFESASKARMTGSHQQTTERTMDNVARVGIDLAKKVFHVTAVDGGGAILERRRLRRAGLQSYLARLPGGCVVAMEACGGAHHWARLARRLGHRAVLMSPQFVAPYVKSNKNDANDADGICGSFRRSGGAGARAAAARARQMARPHGAGQPATASCWSTPSRSKPRGRSGLLQRLAEALEDAENELPVEGRALLRELGEELGRLEERVATFDALLAGVARQAPACRRLMEIPGIGVLTATALVAAAGDASEFRNGREMAAWLGLVPRQHSTGGRSVLLGISKRGDRYLRALLIHGARSALHRAGRRSDRRSRWAVAVETRRGANVAAVALANKNARVAWALLRHGESYDAAHRQSASPCGRGGAGRRRAGGRMNGRDASLGDGRVSSRCAASPLRCDPSGDTRPSPRRRWAVAESKLPATADTPT